MNEEYVLRRRLAGIDGDCQALALIVQRGNCHRVVAERYERQRIRTRQIGDGHKSRPKADGRAHHGQPGDAIDYLARDASGGCDAGQLDRDAQLLSTAHAHGLTVGVITGRARGHRIAAGGQIDKSEVAVDVRRRRRSAGTQRNRGIGNPETGRRVHDLADDGGAAGAS